MGGNLQFHQVIISNNTWLLNKQLNVYGHNLKSGCPSFEKWLSEFRAR